MKTLQIGVTGGMGSGKSLVSKIFHCLGAPVYDADSRAKNVMTTDGILISQIRKEFGVLSYHSDGTLNREFIGKKVFSNPSRLKVLNELVHPRVAEDYKKWIHEHLHFAYVIKEAALLFEAGSYRSLDWIILVSAPEELRIKRVIRRDAGRTVEQVKDILLQQWSEEKKAELANGIIKNDESELVIPQVVNLHNLFEMGRLPSSSIQR
ncbi:MAG TPA: dephospho-CoA kinase [Cyclobacteriaceae bacterium]|nr:dephospho-CoA kinase [Cyclobacteriaceae bacterium]